MNDEQSRGPRHESVDHERPTDAGPMNNPGDGVPGTDIMGDETLVESTGDGPPGIVPGPSRTPGPRRKRRWTGPSTDPKSG